MNKKALTVALAAALLAAVFPLAASAASSDKPRIAVIEFENKADNQYWWHGGGEALQDVFVTELVKSGKFRVVDREQLNAVLKEQNLTLSGSVSTATAVKAGKLLGVQYLLTGAVTEYGVEEGGARGPGIGGLPSFNVKKKTFTAAVNARLIDTETGEILWADEGRAEEKSSKVHVGGFGGGVEDQRMFDKVMKPIVGELVASIKAADI